MTNTFTAFMTGLIDYAGLFPPAELDLDTSIRNYARYRSGPDAWMLGRFIIPANRLDELAPYHDELFTAGDVAGSPRGTEPGAGPFRFSLLVGGGDSADLALDELRSEAHRIRAFLDRHGEAVRVELLETRLPRQIATSAESAQTAEFLQAWQSILAGMGLSELELYVEIAGTDDWPRCVGAAIAGIEGVSRSQVSGVGGFTGAGDSSAAIARYGVKLRCGGATPETVPSPERVALVIAQCRKHGVPLKCTAGLHHPLRHYDAAVGAANHGFFNVFGAGLLAGSHDLTRDEIELCLLDKEASHFRFDDENFAWRDNRMTAAEVAAGRQRAMISFGSCSFDEPRADLRELGLLC